MGTIRALLGTNDPLTSLQLVDVLGKLGLEVTSLVGVDNVLLSQLVEHCRYLWESCSCLSLVGSGTELANGVTCSLGIVTVCGVAGNGLLDALL